jgi:natural product biosynthesis luciferase-like monooxygenase protein
MTNSWRSVLIGSESLLIQCGQMLEQAGHQIVAVVATRPAIRRWASERGIRVLADSASLLTAQDLRPFDYLFSITNLSVLPAEVVALPTRAAINFHDGPLPEYAGLNTPIWAMLNGEGRHGITWHLMTAAVDQGDILVQRRFDLSANETALTLNTKCFEAGMESFEDVVKGLASGELKGQPQTLTAQKYFGRKDRPAAACAIRWDQPAATIATLVRALDFGTYANPLGSAKASYNGQLLIVPELRVLDARSTLPPGTVVSATDTDAVVATADLDVQLTRLETLDGKPKTFCNAGLALRAGARFDLLDDTTVAQLTAANAAVSAHENFWLRRLETQSGLELPHIDRSAAPAAAVYQSLDLALPALPAAATIDTRVAAFIGYLARLTDKDGFDLGFADATLRNAVGAQPAWFAQQVPLRAVTDFSRSTEALAESVAAELREVRKRVAYATDLIARTPELRAVAAHKDPRVLPVALLIVDALDQAAALPGSELTLAITTDGRATRWLFDAGKLDRAAVQAMQAQALVLLQAAEADARRALAELPLWDAAERARVLNEWNATDAPVRTEACMHRLFEEQAARTPGMAAVTCEGESLTYAELNGRANQLARRLKSLGVGPDVLVGLCVERSVEMMVGLIAIHKAGGAYVPLDPSYPKDRIAYMVEDSKVPVLLTQDRVELPKHNATVIKLDTDWASIATESADPFDGGAQPQHLAYVIYTSGSTGKPKGVMIEHRNAVNFFAGMDRHLGDDVDQNNAGTWLAVTSLSFDISVLELCWTLTRGYHVVIATGEERSGAATKRGPHAARALDFSLFYFSADEAEGQGEEKHDKYKLLLEGAKYGDQHGFSAVWTPERHFHAFGGLYPNPAVAGAAIAAVTERIKIRAGSVVLPLHHPLRVAEEWSVVDNISKGRVGISFASGWQPNDFVLKPENFADNKNIMLRNIEVVRKLWRGEKCSFPGATGGEVEVGILPRPVQKELPYWVTSAGNPETFIAAGKLGANVLTHLLGQTVEELDGKLAAYRKAWKDAGHPGEGYVTLMLHTYVGPDEAAVREKVKQPLIDYLKTSLNLVKQYAWSFPAFKKREGMDDASSTASVDLQSLSDEEMQGLLEHSFNRYYETSGLFGTPESCLKQVDSIKAIGVDEVACLIDFGVDSPSVLSHLEYLNELRKIATPRRVADADYSIPTLLKRHQVTHLQCTPSMARMLLLDPAATPGLRGLKRLMVGGEALQPSLARELKGTIAGHLMNMYGPTETTIWSAVHRVDEVAGIVPLGKPLANQEVYILDTRQQPVPVGVPGELVIGGKGVVRGYLHRPELTAERFVPHPFRGAAGGRVYRTGDLARHRPDGTLEFLGRLDHQVKVRGYRIELGEIESSLLTHSGVRETVVVAREDTPGDVRLVAYLVAAGKEAVPASDLKEYLRARLPDYMVPAHFVHLDALPQTPNGKIDRKALPAPEASKAPAAAAEAFVPPSNDLEQQIAAIWKDVLKLPEVGTRDNFFDLGGHSLLAVQAHRKLRDTLQRDLSITDIFRFPTIQSLSAYLGSEGAEGAAAQQGQDRAAGRRAAMARRQNVRTPTH